ncbi:hypothetical protein [Halococcus agarilyticus]|uniref:hypothetical protein n=1 Tax=Halococcus agarilyticus TaxID=1232219 RepID=UPI0006778A54|nr:hypothetical protein [Halococcus agarilyticus]
MDFEISSDDFDEIEERLMEVQRRIAEFRAGTKVSLAEFFAPTLMREHTQFESFAQFRDDCPRNPNTGEELAAIPDEVLDPFATETTEFESWQAMQNRAAQEEIISQLTF